MVYHAEKEWQQAGTVNTGCNYGSAIKQPHHITFCRKYECLFIEKSFQSEPVFL